MEIQSFLNQFGLSEEETQLMMGLLTPVSFTQGERVGKVNAVADTIYYVESGMIRAYRIIDGDDFTYAFFPSGELCVDYQSLILQSPSQLYLECLSPTKAYALSYTKIQQHFAAHPRIERIGFRLSQSAYLRLADRVNEFQTDSLEQRYLNLIEHHEDLFQMAPLQHLASYLGVKPQSLSRIRAKIVKK